jgi:hypothetical protein
LVVKAELFSGKRTGQRFRALDASWQQQDQASGFLTSGGADSGILALPALPQGAAGLYVAAGAILRQQIFRNQKHKPLDRA